MFPSSFKQKSGEMWKWILRVWDNGGRNIKLESGGSTREASVTGETSGTVGADKSIPDFQIL